VREVLPAQPKEWSERLSNWWYLHDELAPSPDLTGDGRPHVVALDFGMKWNIPRHLTTSLGI